MRLGRRESRVSETIPNLPPERSPLQEKRLPREFLISLEALALKPTKSQDTKTVSGGMGGVSRTGG